MKTAANKAARQRKGIFNQPKIRYRVKADSRHFKTGDIVQVHGEQGEHYMVRQGRSMRQVPKHHLEKIEEGLMSFRRFLAEAPYYTEVDKDHENASMERKVHEPDREYPWKKIGTLNGHEVHRQRFGDMKADSFRVVHPQTRKVVSQLDTDDAYGGKKVTMVSSIKNSPVKAHELYHHLVTTHGFTLHSDTSQSPGGVHIWKKLHGMKGIKMSHTSDNTGKAMTLHTGDNWAKNYGFNSYFTAKKA